MRKSDDMTYEVLRALISEWLALMRKLDDTPMSDDRFDQGSPVRGDLRVDVEKEKSAGLDHTYRRCLGE